MVRQARRTVFFLAIILTSACGHSKLAFMNKKTFSLTPEHHPSDVVGLTYVYPVVSRRAGGVSVGINLNTNHACNWRCCYCQVPDLQRGAAPAVNLSLLEHELTRFLTELLHGDFMQRHVPMEARVLRDIALSGDGEPTSAREFAEVIERVGEVMARFDLVGKIPLVVISNGSQMDKVRVQTGLRRLAELGGQLWFKLDSATASGMRRMNGTRISPQRQLDNLRLAMTLCPVWIQTCVLAWDGQPPDETEQVAWLAAVCSLAGNGLPVSAGIGLQGVLLYGLARPSMQVQAVHLSPLPQQWLVDYAQRIEACGIPVRVHA